MIRAFRSLVTVACIALIAVATPTAAQPSAVVTIASKPFTESYILAELAAQTLERAGYRVIRRPGLGATEVAFSALRTGAIDVYPEYVGTGLLVILRDSIRAEWREDPRRAFRALAAGSSGRFGVQWLPPLGFANGYALAIRRTTADSLSSRTASAFAEARRAMRGGFTADFIGRPDGWPALQRAYGWTLPTVRPLAPSLKYDALRRGLVDIVDGYATDAALDDTSFVVLEDDRSVFPPYDAAFIVGDRLTREQPGAVQALSALSGRITEADVRRWNRRVEGDRVPINEVARDALREVASAHAAPRGERDSSAVRADGTIALVWDRRADVARWFFEHVRLVGLTLGLAALLAFPLGVWLSSRAAADRVLQALAVVQTIPGLALLALLVPVAGVGALPAGIALWLYALFPLLQSTIIGLRTVDPVVREALQAMGATPAQVLRWAQFPLAAPVLVAGLRTATVWSIGTATLAAFVGGGGLGEPIVTGLALADGRLVFAGALPAAALAVLADILLARLQRWAMPAYLRVERGLDAR